MHNGADSFTILCLQLISCVLCGDGTRLMQSITADYIECSGGGWTDGRAAVGATGDQATSVLSGRPAVYPPV